MSSSPSQEEPIAIIGSGCRFAGGGSSPCQLWDLLSQPRDVLSEIPPERFDPHGFYHPDGSYSGHSNVLHSYILDEDHRAWDTDFFGVSAQEAVAIDPQQRLLMECVYEALEASGQRIHDLRGSDTAVYVGLMCEEYSDIQLRELNTIPKYFPTGTARSIVANRISYFFDWHGASMTIDTACSSSLIAVHQAVQVLRSGASRMAVAAGTNLILGPEPYIAETTFRMLSPRGRSHMWDVGADGYGRGDGVAVVVLKRLSHAIADGDPIDCIIRETGVNQDGRTNGITAPSADSQVALIQDTYRRAGLNLDIAADRPQFFEAHGTGTIAGDPVEAEAIHRAIGRRLGDQNMKSTEKLFVGSIKTIIGHTEGAAGLAGLLKVSLAIQHKLIPPNLLFERLNPAIEPFYAGLKIPVHATAWPATGHQPRRASVNSFGFGGTNAHIIVESYEPERGVNEVQKLNRASCVVPYTFSAATQVSLQRMLQSLVRFLEGNPDIDAHDLAFTLNTRRSILPFRAAYTGHGIRDLKEKIKTAIKGPKWETDISLVRGPPGAKAQFLGIFTGQGAQWDGMGRELFDDLPFARARLSELETALTTLPPADRPRWSLVTELSRADTSESRVNKAEFAQPLSTALQIVLLDLLATANVSFSAVVGHSSGEIAAAYAVGVLSARDAIIIAYYRGLYSLLAKDKAGKNGSMLAVGTSLNDAEEVISLPQFEGRLTVAAHNAPSSVTISGDADAVQEVQLMFQDEGKFVRVLRVDKAYHSHHMHPCATPYLEALQRASVRAAKPRDGYKWYSSVFKGTLITGDSAEGLDGTYWVRNMVQTVHFSTAVESALTSTGGLTMTVEIGPHGALRGPYTEILACTGKSTPLHIGCLQRGIHSSESFGNALGRLWAESRDGALDLDNFQVATQCISGLKRTFLQTLPKYPWDHKRIFWHESRRSRSLRARPFPGHPLLGTLAPDSTESDILWHSVLRISDLPWLAGHKLQGEIVFPAAGYVILALEAAMHLASMTAALPSPQRVEVKALNIGKALVFENESVGIETLFSVRVDQEPDANNERAISAAFRLRSAIGEGTGTILNASGSITILFRADDSVPGLQGLPAQEQTPSFMVNVDDDIFYSTLRDIGYHYSMSFRALESMKRKLDHGRCQLIKPCPSKMHPSETQLIIHPGVLDAALQSIFLAYSWPGDGRLSSLQVPIFIQNVHVDVTHCRTNLDRRLNVESIIIADGSTNGHPGIFSDVNIYSEDGRRGIAQIEGIHVIPFGPTSESQDTQMFFTNVSGVAFPDGALATNGGLSRASAEEFELGWFLERISHFYLKRLVDEITIEEESRAAWYHKKLMDFARYVTTMVSKGEQPYGKKEWIHDTTEVMGALMDANQGKIEVQLMRSVGKHLAEAIRGETMIIEHMLKDGMLHEYYSESLGLKPYTMFLAEVIGQITHVNPHLRILEIGAGTGGATKRIMRRLRDEFEHYTFTDISSGFFEVARKSFGRHITAGRMTFAVLDIEKDIDAQNFQDQSYDIIVASLVLHATKDLEHTLRNVRRLLKPGGFLVMTEVTSNVTMRLSFTMGGLEGWWLGAETGRPWTPCVSAAEWHRLLLLSGFSGVETSTPELDVLPRPFGVLVSRAVDERIKLLIQPSLETSPLSAIADLLIVAGNSLHTVNLAQVATRILQPHCQAIKIVMGGLEYLDYSTYGSTPLTVLYLGDLDQPVFEELSPAAFDGLRTLFYHTQNLLWVTSGARCANPYSTMSLGLGRAMSMEQPNLRVQLIDYAAGISPEPRALADDLLRLIIATRMEQETPDRGCLWSHEPEIVVDDFGRRWVSRVMPHLRYNNCYNSARRTIKVDAYPAHELVEVYNDSEGDADRLSLRARIDEGHHPCSDDAEFVTVHSLYSITLVPKSQLSEGLYAHIGPCYESHKLSVVFSHILGSMTQAQKSTIIPYNHSIEEAPARLLAMNNQLIAWAICNVAGRDGALLLVEPTEDVAKIVSEKAKCQRLNVICVTTSPIKDSHPFTFIHPHATKHTLKEILPKRVAEIIMFSDGTGRSEILAQRLLVIFPRSVRLRNLHSVLTRGSTFPAPVEILQNAIGYAVEAVPNVNVVSVEEYVSTRQVRGMAIIDWALEEKLSLTVKPSDALPLLRGDRTYLLFGLAGKGGLGSSLAEYLIRQGARHIILTSRNPSIDDKLISTYDAQGIKIQAKANDITNESSVRELVTDIRTSGLWPPIAGVANGAMVLNDATLQTMSYHQMMQVINPKVQGSRILDQIFHDDRLDFFILFSSLSCVLGREGQANYDAANMYLVGLAEQRRARGACASVIDIGAIMGVGYMAREVSERTLALLSGAGYRKMSERDFHITFANGILAGRSQTENTELISGLYLASLDENSTPIWTRNPRFAHVVTRKVVVDKPATPSMQMESTQDLLKQAKTKDDVSRVIQFAIIGRLRNILQAGGEDSMQGSPLLQPTSRLGVDSLVAIEIRSWMLRELEVDVPVLKLMSDATVQEIVNFTTQRLPENLTPQVYLNANDPVEVDFTSINSRTQTAELPLVSTFRAVNPSTQTPAQIPEQCSESVSKSPSNMAIPTSNQPADASSILPHANGVSSRAMDKVIPLSYGQLRFWLMAQIAENPFAFNVTCDIEIQGEVDIPVMEQVVRLLGSRHEALRTCFFTGREHGNQPVQGVFKDSLLYLERVSTTDSEVDGLLCQMHKTTYDLEKGKLMRIILASVSATRHHLLIGYHHINMDSSSLSVLVNDLRKLYDGQNLSTPQVQSSDFTLNQLGRVRNGHWNREISFWREELSMPPDPIPILNISPRANLPRPGRPAYESHSQKIRVATKVANDIRALCQKARVSPFNLYTTVLQILIARLTSRDEFCIGMAYANRDEIGVGDSVGNFLNLLPIRLKTTLDQPFESVLKRTKEKIARVLSNSAVPFEIILDQIQQQRRMEHSPLFQVFIDYRQVTEKLSWGNGTFEGKRYLLSKTPYDVALDIIDTPSGEASVELSVQDGIYTPGDASRILGCYMNMLYAFTEHDDLAGGEANMFQEQEIQVALRLGHGEPMKLVNATILPEIVDIATSQPSEIALEDTAGNSLSWSQMMAKFISVAKALVTLEIPAHSRIGILQEPTVDWIYSVLGVWHSGNAYVPLEISQGVDRLRNITKVAQLAAILTHDATASLTEQVGVPDSIRVLNISSMQSTPWQLDVKSPTTSPNDEAMLMYTSGSTGSPKGIVIPHRVVLNAMKGVLHQWPMQPQTVLQQVPISFDLSWWGALLGLVTKGKVVVAGRDARIDPRLLTNYIVKRNISLTVATPTETTMWLENGDLAALRSSGWEWHIAAGEPFNLGLVRQLQTLSKTSLRVINAYGPTEAMIPIAHEVSWQLVSAGDMPLPIGTVMANYTVRVVDSQGQPVPVGVPGQLVIGGAGIAHGYDANKTLTAERFPKDNLAGPAILGQGWDQVHMSGDLGYVGGTDGVFKLVGRIEGDTQVKLRGLRMDLLEIETNIIFTAKGQISEAAVHLRKPRDNDTSSHYLAAIVTLSQDTRFHYRTGDELTSFLHQVIKSLTVPDYMRPATIEAVEMLPRTTHGKLDRKALDTWTSCDMTLESHPSGANSKNRGSVARLMTAGQANFEKARSLWLNVLGEAGRSVSLTPESDFFFVGGNSLLLIRMQGDLKRQYDVDVPLRNLFQYSTLGLMASLLDRSEPKSPNRSIDWMEETRLQSNLVQLQIAKHSHPKDDFIVALTGASGFLGQAILRRLAARPEIKTIYCLATRNPSALANMGTSKIVVCSGDLSLPNLGMDEYTIQTVFSSADVVIHNGADTSFLKSYDTVRATNLGSTKDIVRHILHYNHACNLHFVSTGGISTLMTRDLFEEPVGALPTESFAEGYILSKWACEIYLENVSAATSLPVTIHRPTTIIGPGAPALDVMSNILHFSEQLRMVPSMSALEGTFQFVDVNDVATSIVSAALSVRNFTSGSSNLTKYHNHNGEPDDSIDVRSFGAYLGKRLDTTPLRELSDAAWILKAESLGMAPEVAMYLRAMNLHDRKGQMWIFRLVRKGLHSLE
ncbi:hypothetical protein F5Y06DRAFT_305204 [Hypoxylon sp. FL0890]|nr:hypothetical protein F5Y06DRAFT_305204 [Hypoxylon sp. FL0890]